MKQEITALMTTFCLLAPMESLFALDAEETNVVKEQSSETLQKSAFTNGWREGKIETAFLLNTHLNNFTIDVDVDGDTATLTGHVRKDIQRDLAEEIAQSVEGIKKVVNHLELADGDDVSELKSNEEQANFSQRVKDATITATAKAKLLQNQHIEGLKINVDTVAGAVTLRGEVPSTLHKDLAQRLVANIDSVIEVHNELEIKEKVAKAN